MCSVAALGGGVLARCFVEKVHYDALWSSGTYPARSCWGCRFGARLVSLLPPGEFRSALDVGAGNGQLVRLLRAQGVAAYGVDGTHAQPTFSACDIYFRVETCAVCTIHH